MQYGRSTAGAGKLTQGVQQAGGDFSEDGGNAQYLKWGTGRELGIEGDARRWGFKRAQGDAVG